jgi:flavin reductase (DIM6/NTAB) family NADH-FMN oxidoreductase RutF
MILDPAEAGKKRSYLLLVSAVVPRPIAWATTIDASGRVNVAPFSFFQGIGASPPSIMLAFGKRRDGSPKDTAANILGTEEFVVNLVTEASAAAMAATAENFPPEVSEAERLGMDLVASTRVAPPRLACSPVSLECRLIGQTEVGGSTVIFGEVVLFHVDDTVLDEDGTIDPDKLRPVSRLGGQLYAKLGDVFEI